MNRRTRRRVASSSGEVSRISGNTVTLATMQASPNIAKHRPVAMARDA
jgi:hypothetical protein